MIYRTRMFVEDEACKWRYIWKFSVKTSLLTISYICY